MGGVSVIPIKPVEGVEDLKVLYKAFIMSLLDIKLDQRKSHAGVPDFA